MRLIDLSSLRLEEFIGNQIPSYAILSHTWQDGEVSFRDWQSNSFLTEKGVRKGGYHKIREFCRLARKDGHRYAWVDTCCIDNTSSAELSEAINSMFKWYRDAKVCYVYLSDVHLEDYSSSDQEHHAQYSFPEGNHLTQSRWFTRGWTLELIAPSYVCFYDQAWRRLGTKIDWSHHISVATGIDVEVLTFKLDYRRYSVASRMAWAAQRKTTREEDITYCLLGLFDINMPLLYGEGNKAFARLQKEIIRVSDDNSILAWGMRESPTWQNYIIGVLAPAPSYFEGSHDVVAFKPKEKCPQRSDSVTQHGLRITLTLVPVHGTHLFYALLDCRLKHNLSEQLGIPLVRIESGAVGAFDSFRRVRQSPRLFGRLHRQNLQEQQIYLLEKSQLAAIFAYEAREICVVRGMPFARHGYYFIGSIPEDHWNPIAQTLELKAHGSGNFASVLRFRTPENDDLFLFFEKHRFEPAVNIYHEFVDVEDSNLEKLALNSVLEFEPQLLGLESWPLTAGVKPKPKRDLPWIITSHRESSTQNLHVTTVEINKRDSGHNHSDSPPRRMRVPNNVWRISATQTLSVRQNSRTKSCRQAVRKELLGSLKRSQRADRKKSPRASNLRKKCNGISLSRRRAKRGLDVSPPRQAISPILDSSACLEREPEPFFPVST